MNRLLFSFSLLLFSHLPYAQVPEKGPLKLQSGAIRLCVTKSENLVLTTRMGEVAQATSVHDLWKRIDPVKKRDGIGLLFDQPNFFNKDTGIVSGFINNKGAYDIIYRTTDGGYNWQAVNFGQSGWVDDAVHLDNGLAWLSVGGSGIAFTEDYGLTWKRIEIPERQQRFTTIYFNTAKEGIIGSLWNMLAWTTDNGSTWRVLPTPLDQKKYSKTNAESRPDFKRVAIYHDYLVASQEGLVFYSAKDSINWVWLPGYTDFYTDGEASALYFKTNAGNFVKAGYDLQPVHTFAEKPSVIDARCRNGSLYIIGGNKVVQLKADGTTVSSPLYTSQSSAMEPEMFGYSTAGIFGVIDNKIYQQDGFGGKWLFLFALPFAADSGRLSLTDSEQVLFSRNDDSLFYYDLVGKETRRTTEADQLRDFATRGIREIIFSRGSQGCFHNYSIKLTYTLRHGQYEAGEEVSSGSNSSLSLPEWEETLDEGMVADFVEKLPLLFDPACKASVEDLGFTEEDYVQCKKDILAFKASLGAKKKKETRFFFNQNNLDFERLLHLVDTIRYLERDYLNALMLQDNGFWSTTTNWIQVQLVNNDNNTLTIHNNHFTPTAFYLPWRVTLEGHSVVSTCMEINRFINRAYPSFLGPGRKVEVLHSLVKELY